MIHLILQMNAIMNDIGGYQKSDARYEGVQRVLSGGNGQSAARHKTCQPAQEELDERNKKCHKNLNQTIAQ